ncbi:TylF/MycF/NovP-related O-methyltransferase [Parvibaculum sp.]|uniref:TylF/MycF/NovP-related O-methyltransferase n=1 Tax=Parvibaculum sp. TaxID=2024848 RepID=UPI001DF9F9E8|nr:TylF/MycF/NovP-related O-methyltransferase [Parvibaculum sp.]MBX3490937.1 class I SAM-dependent methyltransferase [Parvibaculum sp.]MCW5728763.1 class I SAM-dependent methyltransferase [Parvibaculum sp.]
MSKLPKPAPCPDNVYVEDTLFRLLSGHCSSENKDAFSHGGVLRFASRRGIAKLLAHYEIFRMVEDLPGHIVELGVFRGDSLIRFAQFAEIFSTYDRSFDVIGFDNFKGFPSFHEKDGVKLVRHDKQEGGWSSESYRDELDVLINVFDHDRFAPQKPRIRLIEGDIVKTVPEYAEKNPGMVIKILHLDADLYEPTRVALEHFWDRLVIGGVLLLDEYGFDIFPGEATAVSEFFAERGIAPTVRKFPFTDNPGGYVVKESF